MCDLKAIVQKSMDKEKFSEAECMSVLRFPDEDLLLLLHSAFKVRKHFRGSKVHVQMLMNAKSGYCAEDCHYCSQSCRSKAKIDKYPLKTVKELVEKAKEAKKNSARRFCMALSSIRYSDKIIDELACVISAIKKETQMDICCSMGFLTDSQAEKLKSVGLDRINHNLNTSKSHYPKICSTHTYDERVDNLNLCREKGLELCSGGIVGLGESKKDIVEMLKSLWEVGAESIPLNFLIPIEGTPLENEGKYLSPQYCLKVLCLARFMHPDKDIRVAGGREYRLRSLQPLALYPANSIFVSGYLTTDGQPADEGLQMIKDMGFGLELEN